MSKESISGRILKNCITSEDILGKEVIDSDGKYIGIVEKVLIDPINMDFVGIEIDKGFLRKGISLGKNYIKKITPLAVFLNIKPAYEIRGMTVFDKSGKRIGKVIEVKLQSNRNKVKEIKVKRNALKKEIKIPEEFIETMGYNIVLSLNKKELLKNLQKYKS